MSLLVISLIRQIEAPELLRARIMKLNFVSACVTK